MVTTEKFTQPNSKQSSASTERKTHLQVIDKTFKNNKNSDYTEKIVELARGFDYASNSQHYWSAPELSLLFGTPLYEVATPTQKLALNHLYWVGNYNHVAVSEASTSLYNMVTNGVFRAVGGYDTLCDELDFETEQESHHIRTFQKIGYKTKVALLGKTILGNSFYNETESQNGLLPKLVPQSVKEFFTSDRKHGSFSGYRDRLLASVGKTMMGQNKPYYSDYLKGLEAKETPLPAPSDGLGGRIAPRHWLRFFTLHWGMSPFMACQYYSIRYTANSVLKTLEYPYVRHFRELQRQGEFIPVPTAISNYHLLDESFHTTISQTLARDVYKDFHQPTPYEKFVAGRIAYETQRSLLGGLSGAVPGRPAADTQRLMVFFFKLLKSPLFEMSTEDALFWMEKCFCQEHEGFHVSLKYHQILLGYMQRLFSKLDYQWRVNREMSLMAKGGSISKAIKNSTKDYQEFARAIAL